MDPEAKDSPVRVLFIEDDPAVAQMYQLKLQLDGYKVTIASDGEAGLQMARDDPPDMVFLDIRLPKMDGLAVLKAIRADSRTKHLPVVILSNYAEKELVESGLKLGALEYLIKSKTNPGMLSGGMDSWLSKG